MACTHVEEGGFSERECKSGEDCTVEGDLTITTDGHGYIGKLDMENGDCLNVSLPDAVSEEHIYKNPTKMKLTGRWLPYVKQNGLVVTVNGRKIGEGLCGDHYLFVR